MNKEQRLAFYYGQTTFLSGGQGAPRYDARMDKLVSESRSESGARRDMVNMRAWYMGYLTQQTELGQGIRPEQFLFHLQSELPGCSVETAKRWVDFANECVKSEQYVDFDLHNFPEMEINRWLETLFAGILQVKRDFGEEIAMQIVDLSQQPNCLYPFEMRRAAEHFQRGGSPDDIGRLIAEGLLDAEPPFFPKLADLFESNEPSTGMNLI